MRDSPENLKRNACELSAMRPRDRGNGAKSSVPKKAKSTPMTTAPTEKAKAARTTERPWRGV
jgi:hypothetical protein